MKKLHLVARKDNFRPELKYIQIKGGFVYVSNGIVFVKFPLEEVFGINGPFTNEDELYIFAEDWERQNLSKGRYFQRVDFDYVEATSNMDSLIGRVKIYNCNEFLDLGHKYPSFGRVIPNSRLVPVAKISFDPFQFKKLIKCIGCHEFNYALEFRGENKVIIVKNVDSEVVAGIMPRILG